MKTAIVHCPNAGCGRISHLGDDPLGRIFRCPHCLSKLPTAAAAAADSRWTAVLGGPRIGDREVGCQTDPGLGLGSVNFNSSQCLNEL